MKTITIIAEQVSDAALAAALPAAGVTSVRITPQKSATPGLVAVDNRRTFRGTRFTPNYRIDVTVDDDTVEAVFDGISFAYGAGVFSDAEAWVSGPALALSA